MEAINVVNQLGVQRFAFIEALSNEFVAMTGYGVYVYLDPTEIERLFNNYQKLRMPVSAFVRQCVEHELNS